MSRIIIQAVTPDQVRLSAYAEPGSGDWFYSPGGDLHIQVTCKGERDVIDRKELFLVALHELVEAVLCRHDGVPQAAVDTFDTVFNGDGEPGDHPEAPYQKQHRMACLIEFTTALFLGQHDYGIME